MDSSNIFLLATVISENFARDLDAATNGRVRYHPPFPDRLDQLVPRNQAIAVANKEGQQLDHLGFGRNGIAVFRKLETTGIQYKLIKGIKHDGRRVASESSYSTGFDKSGLSVVLSNRTTNNHNFIKSSSNLHQVSESGLT